jgi:hypothetical protein
MVHRRVSPAADHQALVAPMTTDAQPATFRQLVKLMRDAQKRYWRQRTQTNNKEMLKLELRVDTWLARHQTEIAEQAELLGDDDAEGTL